MMKKYFTATIIVLGLFIAGDIGVFHILRSGLDRYYGLNKQAKILCVGHSHTVLGLDAERMQKELGTPVSKYAMAGANTLDRLWMVRHFLAQHPSVNTVIYDVDPWLFDTEGLSSASYTLFLPYINDPGMSSYLFQQATWQEYVVAKYIGTARFRDQTLLASMYGLLGMNEKKKESRIRIEDYQNDLTQKKSRGIRINPDSLKCFTETIDYLVEQGVTVVLLGIPTLDLLNNTAPQDRDSVFALFTKISNNHKNVLYFNYNKDYESDHKLFYDLRHLNKYGNAVVTDRLIRDLRLMTTSNNQQ